MAKGYTIPSWRNRGDLRISENLMPNDARVETAARRPRPTADAGEKVLSIHGNRHTSRERDICRGLRDGDIGPVGGGTVKPPPDHQIPHALHAVTDAREPSK